MLTTKLLKSSFFLSTFGNMVLKVSLNAKLNAWVGNYRRTLVKLPRQNAWTPCSALIRLKQSTMPV